MTAKCDSMRDRPRRQENARPRHAAFAGALGLLRLPNIIKFAAPVKKPPAPAKGLDRSRAARATELYRSRCKDVSLVILDMIMPGMSGGETFDRLRLICPDAKVLLASGYSVNGQAREIMERGCLGFIQKPFSVRELSLKVRDALADRGTGRAAP